ncbi:MAG: LPS export ABC transporter periplasmic protein LptC [Cellvibrionaceae bacterium]|nr:LPS export ABC transporter periplasmic protein LptC [Cellvibrionaceae bacterium]
MPKHWISLLLLTSLIIVFVIFWESPPDILGGAKPSPAAEFPSAYLINSHSRQYDQQGELELELKAAKIIHYQATPGRSQTSDHADMELPELALYNEDQAPWYLKAEKGRSNHDGSRLRLMGNVYAWQTHPKQGRSELHTEVLVIDTKRSYVETDETVKIRTEGHDITAVGLKANLTEQSLQLLNRVRGVHELPN